ncbi:hypothetical protein M409DRAFT_53398 [Zasmidium cellare ATCC 36951]|uniref:Uncharacterized protein n=1 Tax=Zasmidium cellare ATCC 36951 TaxID=1080233 RepID=A0A6A6CRG3_ZASCE|nr:uncharacterized protein M409DRAFT_53398 [Zasmidium cellare ATCC 36951]KAF2168076.1 hypothetical protein M409DRAFT_53398 [Zasmidium cellare ATCC 36951]
MAVEIVDLCSSDEESPRKAAEGALAGFKPRKNKITKLVSTNGTAAQQYDFDFNDDRSWGNADSSSPLNGGPNTDFKPYESYHDARAENFEEHNRSHSNAVPDLVRIDNVERSNGQQSLEEAKSNGHWEYSNGGSGDDIMASGNPMGEHTWTTRSANDANTSFEARATSTRTGNQTDYPSERSFRIDKSKRYGHSSVQDRVRERPLTAQSSSSLSSPPESSLLNKFLSGSPEGNNVESGDGASTNQNRLQITQPAKTSILSGAGLEVVRMREENGPKDVLGKLENGIKRQASLLVDSADSRILKRPRAEESFVPQSESLRSSRPPAILIDVTNPDTERVSYSDEPEIEDSIRMKSSTSTTTNSKPVSTGATQKEANPWKGPGTREPYHPEEDELLCQLKADGLSWDEIVPHFNGRTKGSLQVRYSTKFAHRKETAAVARPGRKKSTLPIPTLERADSSDNVTTGRAKRARNAAPSAVDGFVSWASVKASRRESAALANPEEENLADSPEPVLPDASTRQDGTFPASISQVLRYRELGLNGRRFWGASPRAVRDDVKNHVYKTYALQKQYHGTSGDVVALSWAPDGDRFAAGSIAISDDRSMQYNMQRNLVVGSGSQSKLREMTEHHIPRPLVDTTDNVNGLHAMRASQDSRLFKTVTATAFSPSSPRKLYTTGEDMMLRRYAVGTDVNAVKCRYEIQHPARVDLLAVSSPHGIVATGCHTDIKSVQLYRCHEKDYERGSVFSPGRRELQSSVPIYPSTLKWGIAYRHCALLLAGFCGDEEKEHAGETCLWDINTGTAIPIRGATRNVFDVAWNPNPSSASTSFAVASKPSSLSVARSTRSVIQCFAPNQQEARKVLTWECPAPDINDVVFCPYDDNLIAAGATNGTVYIWDQRSADRSQNPLHILHHGATENILAHDRDPETADTGVRFLSWGATKTRLYSGSHDGIVKVWNPYRSPNNAHVDDIAPPRHERSAVMSGTFNQDHRELLVGTENGRINLFSIEANPVYKAQQFKLETAPAPAEDEQEDSLALARSMIDSGKIEIRPCGALPFRQAVQGPNYEGPFMAPSSEEINKAEEKCTEAMIAQSDAHLRQAQLDPDDDAETARADSNAVAAQRTLDELNQRLEHFHFAQPKAAEFQRALFQAEHDRAELLSQLTEPVEACTLPCGVLPTAGDGVEDSGRSVLRIPQMLRSIEQNAAVASIGDEESVAACASCFPLQALKRKGKPSFCVACKLKKAGLIVSCSRCAGPARLQTDTSKETLCERCSFTCFRCTRTPLSGVPSTHASNRRKKWNNTATLARSSESITHPCGRTQTHTHTT